MRYDQRKKKKSRWIISVILALALMISINLPGEVHGVDSAAMISVGGVDTYYDTLDKAIAAVGEDQTIRLLNDIVLIQGASIVVNKLDAITQSDVSFFLDLGGKVISGDKEGALLQVDAGKVTVYNGEIINTFKTSETSEPSGLAVSGNVQFPIGDATSDLLAAELDIPVAYHLQFTNSANGTILFGSADGTQIPLPEETLYAGENTAFTFFFVSDEGYKVDTFTINGESQTTAAQYTISDLTKDESINVNFSIITFTIAPLAYVNDVVAKLGLSVVPTPATVEYGKDQTFTYTVRTGFKLIDVKVNGESIGAVTTIELKNITSEQVVEIVLEKTALFIMLDAGHYENYNHSPVLSSYYEGNTMWVYHKYLEQSLEQYPNIIVETTRPNNSRAVGEVLVSSQRGNMSEGYDLMLSVHSNAASTSSADHPVAIYTLDPRYTSVSRTLGLKLATKVAEVMNTYQAPEVYSKAQSDGRDWYGINRGAADVGVPSIILEHSFHTNYRATVWLSSDANLRTLAAAEAKVIAEYYGIAAPAVITPPPAPVVTAPPAPTGPWVNVVAGVRRATVTWSYVSGASGYQIYRAYGTSSKYYKVKTIYRGGTLKWTNTGRSKGKIYTYKVRSYKKVNGRTVYGPFSTPKSVRIK